MVAKAPAQIVSPAGELCRKVRMHMKNRRILRIVCFLVLSGMLFGMLPMLVPTHISAETVETNGVSRLINIVYDDSRSMHLGNSLAWCQAKYSLEVFSAMMQDQDCMNIYFMSQFAGMSQSQASSVKPLIGDLTGDRSLQQSNITRIHDTVTRTRGTYFQSIAKAYSDLKSNTQGYDEKWLVVITDGDSFSDGETAADLDAAFSGCYADQIKIVYLAIGDNALAPVPDATRGLFVYDANVNSSTGDNGILARVTQICQRIFQRPSVANKESNAFTLDIPASEVIIFAQGKNVEIGDLNGAKKTVSSATIGEKDKTKATSDTSDLSEVSVTELHGTIVTFTPSNGTYFDEGTYKVTILADEYIVYYKPCLDVILNVKDGSGKYVTDQYIPAGSYTLEYWLSYPEGHAKHGEKIPSSLFDISYDRTLSIDGNKQTLSSDTVELTTGDVEISVAANYLTFISSIGTVKYIVEDFTIEPIDVALEYLQTEYLLSTLETENEGILVKVSKDGAPLTGDEWAEYQLETQADGLDLYAVKNSDSSFTIYPRYADGDRAKTKTGDVPFLVDVFAHNGHRKTFEGTANGSVNIYDDVTAVELGVTIDEQDMSVSNKDFNDQPVTRKVTITWAGKPLTKAQYDALKLTAEVKGKKLSATIEPDPYVEGGPTTATVTFHSEKEDIIKLNGNHDFTVQAEVETADGKSEGQAKSVQKVDDARTFMEKFLDFLPYLLGILLLLFLILAYAPLIKHYLPRKILPETTGRLKGGSTHNTYRHIGALLTVLIPFMSVRTTVTGTWAGMLKSADFKLKAGKGRTAICVNRDTLNSGNIWIGGTRRKGNVIRHGTTIYSNVSPILTFKFNAKTKR